MSPVLLVVCACGSAVITFLLVARAMRGAASRADTRAPAVADAGEMKRIEASFTNLKSTAHLEVDCPNHPGRAASGSCRYCKREYCSACLRTTAGQEHCNSKRCVEAARAFALAGRSR